MNCRSIISQVIIFLKVFTRWISILNLDLFWSLYSLLTCPHLTLCCFGLLRTSSRSARCRLVSVSIFAGLVCSTPPVDLLVVDLSRQSRQSVSTFSVETSTRSACCSVLSGSYLNTPYFRRTGSCKLIFHSPKLLSIRSKKNWAGSSGVCWPLFGRGGQQ